MLDGREAAIDTEPTERDRAAFVKAVQTLIEDLDALTQSDLVREVLDPGTMDALDDLGVEVQAAAQEALGPSEDAPGVESRSMSLPPLIR